MNALSILVVAVLAIPYLLAIRVVAGHYAWWQVEHRYPKQDEPDGLDWSLATFAAYAITGLLGGFDDD